VEFSVQEQFLQTAEALLWDLETQIDRLDEFVRAYGAAGRMDAELSEVGLSVSQSFHREALCGAMLRFIERLGAAGAFSHFLHRQLQHESAASSEALQPRTRAGSASRVGALMRRWLGREAGGGQHAVAS